MNRPALTDRWSSGPPGKNNAVGLAMQAFSLSDRLGVVYQAYILRPEISEAYHAMTNSETSLEKDSCHPVTGSARRTISKASLILTQ